MRPLFTKHVSHPVRSRFSAFAFTGTSTKGGQRIEDDEATAFDSSNGQTVTSKTLTSKRSQTSKTLCSGSSKTPQPTMDSVNGQDESMNGWRMDEWERDIIRPLPAGAHSHYSIGTPEYPAKHCRRKEHWEIIEEREREEEERAQKQKMDPSKWEQRKQQWERIERMSSKGRSDGKKQPDPSRETPHPMPPEDSWYNGWGNRMGYGDGNQGWELELGPLAGGVEVPPTVDQGGTREGGFPGDVEAFGKF